MMTKVRQFREDAAKLQTRLRQRTDSLAMAAVHEYEPNDQMSADQMHRQQVLQGVRILEDTSQSLIR